MSTPSQEHPPPEQTQEYPGRTGEMDPQPRDEMRGYEGRGLLAGKRTLVTGGDSGIGRAVAVAFAKEGADVAIAYLSEQAPDLRHPGPVPSLLVAAFTWGEAVTPPSARARG